MKIETLRRKARDGSLEVEHLLQAAAERLPGLSDELSRLAVEQQWQSVGLQPDGSRVVPLKRWAEVASAYSDHEFEGLRTLAEEKDFIPFVLGLVEELPTPESVSFALELAGHYLADLDAHEQEALLLTRSFNLLLSFKQAPSISDDQARDVQRFLIAVFPRAATEADKAMVLLALRGVGDRDALQFVESADSLGEPWAETKATAARAIRKRVKARHLSPPSW